METCGTYLAMLSLICTKLLNCELVKSTLCTFSFCKRNDSYTITTPTVHYQYRVVPTKCSIIVFSYVHNELISQLA